MGLIEFIIVAAVIGLVVYLVTTLIPMPQPIRTIIVAVACLILILILIRALGFSDLRMGPIR